MNVVLFSCWPPDMKQAKVLLHYAEGTLESTPLMKQLLDSRTADTLTLAGARTSIVGLSTGRLELCDPT